VSSVSVAASIRGVAVVVHIVFDVPALAGIHTVKKISDIPVPSRDITYQTLPGWK
jgi:hypothetical protein